MAAGLNGGVAQLGEHLPCKQGVMSSNLTISTDPKGSKASYGSASAKTGVGALKTEYRKSKHRHTDKSQYERSKQAKDR